jgi:hypothetical protein
MFKRCTNNSKTSAPPYGEINVVLCYFIICWGVFTCTNNILSISGITRRQVSTTCWHVKYRKEQIERKYTWRVRTVCHLTLGSIQLVRLVSLAGAYCRDRRTWELAPLDLAAAANYCPILLRPWKDRCASSLYKCGVSRKRSSCWRLLVMD